MRNFKEIEIRAVIEDISTFRKNLRSNNFKLLKTVTQEDIIFDTRKAKLFRSGKKIRIRIEDEEMQLTYKSKIKGSKISERKEVDVTINLKEFKNLKFFLESIGYSECFRIYKRREVYSDNSNVKIYIDEWPIIGFLVEIEGKKIDIKKMALSLAPDINFSNPRLKQLFIEKSKREGKTLLELQEKWEKLNDKKLGNLNILLG